MLNARLLRLDDQAHEHAHDYHQLVLSLSGSAAFEVDGAGGEVCRMRACLVPGYAEHEFAGKGDNRMLIIDLDEQDLSADDPRLLAQLFETPRYPALDADFHNLLNYAGAELARYGSDPLLARALGGVLLRALHLRVFGEAAHQPKGPLDIARLDAHIESNLARRITVAELAQVVCLSP
ncbi:AraC family transcriptional regulator, partial [uncultured Stutzerimonas sp.]